MECLGCEGERVLRGKWYLRVQVMKGCGYEVWEVRCWVQLAHSALLSGYLAKLGHLNYCFH